MKFKCLTAFLLLLFAALSVGCATTSQENQSVSKSDEEESQSIDPYEDVNRPIYDFTDAVDRNILAPVANTYIDYIPKPVRTSVGNFYDNLGYPNTIVNSFLQGKMIQGTEDSLRLIINSTLGLAGLFDVATPMGLKKNNEDFGQTLGVWGVDSTSYMYVPLLGPTSNRDIYGIPFTLMSNALFWGGFIVGAPVTVPLGVLAVIDKRARVAEDLRIRDQAALDPYLFVREAYWQQRQNLVFDGKPPIDAYDELFTDDLSYIPTSSLDTDPCLETPVQHKFAEKKTWHPPLILDEYNSEQDCSLFASESREKNKNTFGKTDDTEYVSEDKF
jgi:phospholipid-binding lipoprotein MlaA